MKINEVGISLIKDFEGCILYSYYDAVGVLTCGYGHTGSDLEYPMIINQKQADDWLKKDLQRFERHVNNINDKYHYNFSSNEFSALVSFAFNIGSISQLVKGGSRNKAEIADAMLLYNKAGGRVLQGLTRRRLAEYNLYMTPDESGLMESDLQSLHHDI